MRTHELTRGAVLRKQWLANQYDLKCAEAVELRWLGSGSKTFKGQSSGPGILTVTTLGCPVDFAIYPLVISRTCVTLLVQLTGDFHSCRMSIPMIVEFESPIFLVNESR